MTDFCANKNRNGAKSVPTPPQAIKALKEKMRRRRRAPKKSIDFLGKGEAREQSEL